MKVEESSLNKDCSGNFKFHSPSTSQKHTCNITSC